MREWSKKGSDKHDNYSRREVSQNQNASVKERGRCASNAIAEWGKEAAEKTIQSPTKKRFGSIKSRGWKGGEPGSWHGGGSKKKTAGEGMGKKGDSQ